MVATYERSSVWPELISALEAQTLSPARFEVVVIDDASRDDTWEALQKIAARTSLRLQCLRAEVNVGSGAARTCGLDRCRAPVVAFTDDDCLPTPTWLERLCAPLLTGVEEVRPALVVQGRTMPVPEESAKAGGWDRTIWVLRPTWLFETCNIAYRMCDLTAVGGFPGRTDTPPNPSGKQVAEDALAGWKVIEHGAALVFEPGAVVHHRVEPSTYTVWLRDIRGRAVFPALAGAHPLARRAFWGRWFLSSRSAATVLAVAAGVLWLVTGRRSWLAGLLPWVVSALPEARHRPGRPLVVRLAQLALGDLVGLAATSQASLRHRRLVL